VATENKDNGELGVRTMPDQRQADEISVSHEEIRRRAYEIYLERGDLPGEELGDWLRAERELQKIALFVRDWNRVQQRFALTPIAEIDIRPMETMERENQ
jgi:Protein of unknown function (DUF2934)